MDDNRSTVIWQSELYLFKHSRQQADEAYCRLLWIEATSFHIVADGTCQPPKYVLPPCEDMVYRN